MAGIKKLKAATLLESLIAMIIIVMCLSIGTMIYSNILSSDKQRIQLKAMFILNSEAQQTKTEKSFLDAEKQVDEWNVKKTVEHYDQTENLYRLSITITDKDGKVVATRNELISTE
jgi:Tfp pilus assembly protein PilV